MPRPLPHHSFEPPRWRRRRAGDLRDIAIVYALALIISLVPWIFVLRTAGSTIETALKIALAIVVYVVAGGVVVALASHRMAHWDRVPKHGLPLARFYTVPLWPATVGVVLLRMARAG